MPRRAAEIRAYRADVLRGVRRMGFLRARGRYLVRAGAGFHDAQQRDAAAGWQLWDVFRPPARAPADAVWCAVSPSGVVAIATGARGPGNAVVAPMPHRWQLAAGMGRTFAAMGRL